MLDQDWHLANIERAVELSHSGRQAEAEALLSAGKQRAMGANDKAGALLCDSLIALLRNDILAARDLMEQAGAEEPDFLSTIGSLTEMYIGRFEGLDEKGRENKRGQGLALMGFGLWHAMTREGTSIRQQQERRDAERAAREQKIKLEAWRSLSARSAHRIGNQLFASLGALRTLRELKAPEAAEAVTDIEASLERIGTIVQEFQRFSVNEKPNALPTDLGPLLGDLVRRYQGIAKDVAVAIDVPNGLPACQVDRNQIDQAFSELLENALHHTPPGGKVTVRAAAVDSPQGQRVVVSVEDNGPGVPAENKERLFEAFFSTRPGGSGLGLAIVRQIVENHGGTIRETGTPGKGARFEVELPAAPKQESNA